MYKNLMTYNSSAPPRNFAELLAITFMYEVSFPVYPEDIFLLPQGCCTFPLHKQYLLDFLNNVNQSEQCRSI